MQEELRFTVRAGALIRGRVIREIKNLAFLMDLDIAIAETKGLLNSTYLITVKGEEEKLLQFREAIEEIATVVY